MPIIDVHGHYGSLPYALAAPSTSDILAVAKMFGIERTCLAASVAILADMEAGNAQLAQAIGDDERLLGYVVVNPNNPEQSVEELRKYLGSKRFIGAKMHSTHHGQPLDSPESMHIIKSLLRFDKPLFVHAPAEQSLRELEQLAKAYVSCTFVLANMGDDNWPAALRMAKRTVNVMLDVGGTSPDADRIKMAVEQVGAHRLVFGTGTPLVHPVYAIGMVRDAQISAHDKDRILYRNAAKLFKLA